MPGRGVTGLWRVAVVGGVSALFVIGQAATADAQFWPFGFRQQYAPQVRPDPRVVQNPYQENRVRRPNRTTADKSKKDVPIKHPFGENMPKGPLQLVVSV